MRSNEQNHLRNDYFRNTNINLNLNLIQIKHF